MSSAHVRKTRLCCKALIECCRFLQDPSTLKAFDRFLTRAEWEATGFNPRVQTAKQILQATEAKGEGQQKD
ncbi:hypothetical protein AGIG_G6302 [Arapaima gigas]